MAKENIDLPPEIPSVLQRRSSDEYAPPPRTPQEEEAVARTQDRGPEAARHVNRTLRDYWSGRRGTAAALRSLNRAWGREWFKVPAEAEFDQAAADAALGGNQLVIDVQTHFIGDHRASAGWRVFDYLKNAAPDRWIDVKGDMAYTLSDWLRLVFLEAENAVAVLTSSPGTIGHNYLPNLEIAGARELVDRFAGTGRVINHSIVHPNDPGDVERMALIKEKYKPTGWKIYTFHAEAGWLGDADGWWLDDETCGLPFLQRVRELGGAKLVCAHKGLGSLAPTASPRDIGPAARAFPDIQFLVYHCGYDVPTGPAEEGPYTEATANKGANRLVKSLLDSKIKPGTNVYAELGSTWLLSMRRPREAAHVLGKMLKAVGEDHVLWGTDSIWYGSPQPEIDAFRTFEIPEEFCEQYGYPRLTPAVKEKILGLNAARVYNIDVAKARHNFHNDDLSWVRAAWQEYTARGMPSVR